MAAAEQGLENLSLATTANGANGHTTPQVGDTREPQTVVTSKKKKNQPDDVNNTHVFMDIEIENDEDAENPSQSFRLIFKLWDHVVPKTAENFRALCTGEMEPPPGSRDPLHYAGSRFHRMIKGFMIQGGDFDKDDGTGGCSIYGKAFPDEEVGLNLKHKQRGFLSMANCGPNTNGSQFFILFEPAPSLDGKHVVFGELLPECEIYLDLIERIPTGTLEPSNKPDQPLQRITIKNCGEVERVEVFRMVECSTSEDESDSGSDSSSESSGAKKKKKKDSKKKKDKKTKKKSKKKKKDSKKKKSKKDSKKKKKGKKRSRSSSSESDEDSSSVEEISDSGADSDAMDIEKEPKRGRDSKKSTGEKKKKRRRSRS